MNIFVLGTGAWGTALSILLVKNGHRVTQWSRRAAKANCMKSSVQNPALPGVKLPSALRITGGFAPLEKADMVVVVTPSYALRETVEKAAPHIKPGTIIVTATKGIERETDMRMSQIIQQIVGDSCPEVALSGPSHAEEVSRGLATGCVAASPDKKMAQFVQETFMNDRFRMYINDDIVGVEMCGALKNVVALGCGAIEGLHLGDNLKALTMTRAMDEIADLCVAAGGQRKTCSGLAGMGDLIVTCCSGHSRNRQAGLLIGGGMSVEDAIQEVGAVVEGYYAAASAKKLGDDLHVRIPVFDAIYEILYEGADIITSLGQLMTREGRAEFDLCWEP